MTEELRLNATVVDKFSKPLNDLRAKLSNVRATDATRSMQSLSRSIDTGVTQSLTRLGAAVGGFTTAFLFMQRALERFVNNVPELASVARETGVALNNIRALQSAGARVGIEANSIAQALQAAAKNSYLMSRNRSEVLAQLQTSAPTIARQLKEASDRKDTKAYVERGITFIMDLYKEKGAVVARQYSELIFGGADLSRFGERNLDWMRKTVKEAIDKLGLDPEAVERAKRARDAYIDLKDSLEKLGNTASSELIGSLEKLQKVFANPESWIHKEIIQFFKDFNKLLEETAALLNGDFSKAFGGRQSGGGTQIPGLGEVNPGAWFRKRFFGTTKDKIDTLEGRKAATEELLQGSSGKPEAYKRSLEQHLKELTDELKALREKLKQEQGAQKSSDAGGGQGGFQYAGLRPPGLGSSAGFNGGANALGGSISSLPGSSGGGSSPGRRAAESVGASVSGRTGGTPGDGSNVAILPGIGGRTPNERRMNSLLKTHGSPWGSIADRSKFIREEAIKAGIDPNIALRVANSEGNNWKFGVNVNPNEASFGAFQLNTKRGVGVSFQKHTGLDASNPQNEPALIRYALQYVARHGWGPWAGASKQGIRGFMGAQRQSGPIGPISNAYGGRVPHVVDAGAQPYGGSGDGRIDRSRYSKDDLDFVNRIEQRYGLNGEKQSPFGGLPVGTAWGKKPDAASTPSGNASLDITLNNFPAGWKTRAEGGGLFKDVSVHSGKAMQASREAGP